jgi:S1-C subfamily serine protease
MSSIKDHRALSITGWVVALLITLVVSGQKQVRNVAAWILKGHSEIAIARDYPLSSVEIFQKVSPSVFVVEALGETGESLDLGSGVAIAPNLLLTNCHVVEGGSSLRIRRGKETWSGRPVEAIPNHDLCGIRPSRLTLQPVEIRPSSELATGEHVYAIGSPEGLELTFSEGVISSLRQEHNTRIIQTSAAISPGSSGGGLFDAQGNLVGITTFQLKEGQSLNFAVPGEWISETLASSDGADAKSSARPSDSELESRAWLAIGLDAVNKETYNLAAHSFRKCADLKQQDASRAWLELGHLGEKAADLSSASDAYKAWLREHQWSAQDAQAKAIAAFESAVELKPDYAEAWFALAGAHARRKEYDEAIPAAKEATRLAPSDWRSWLVLGNCYMKTESYAEAIDALQRGEKVAPDETKPTIVRFTEKAYAKQDREQVK